jgi:hypothetical protein
MLAGLLQPFGNRSLGNTLTHLGHDDIRGHSNLKSIGSLIHWAIEPLSHRAIEPLRHWVVQPLND